MAAQHDVLLAIAQLLAGGHADLLLHQIHPTDHLGHRVLDLDARVHLDEVKLAILEQELECSDAAIADLAAGVDAALADPIAQLRGQLWRRRLFHHFLMAALQ